jgi:hypothetical protein
MDPSGKSLYVTGAGGIARLTLCGSDADCADGELCTIDACDAGTGVCQWERLTGCRRLSAGFVSIRRSGRITVKGRMQSDSPPRVDQSAGFAVRLVGDGGFDRTQTWAAEKCHVRRSRFVCRSRERRTGRAIAAISTRGRRSFSIRLPGERLRRVPSGPLTVTLIGNVTALDANAGNAELARCTRRPASLVCRQAE